MSKNEATPTDSLKFERLTATNYKRNDAYMTWSLNIRTHIVSIPLPDKYFYRVIPEKYLAKDSKTYEIILMPVTNLLEHLDIKIPFPTLGVLFKDIDNWDLSDAHIEKFQAINAGWQNAEAKINTLITTHLDAELTIIYMQGGPTVRQHVEALLAFNKNASTTEELRTIKQNDIKTDSEYAQRVAMLIFRLAQSRYPPARDDSLIQKFKEDTADWYRLGMHPSTRDANLSLFENKGIEDDFAGMRGAIDARPRILECADKRRNESTMSVTARAMKARPSEPVKTEMEILLDEIRALKTANTELQRSFAAMKRGGGSASSSHPHFGSYGSFHQRVP
ncbi:hypothetical protein HK101_005445 [Irineochytrium annulatum]|nr:hypothetical protein HK101_005445 [Irineochytrium annulatum]